jgi:hypothetical protein
MVLGREEGVCVRRGGSKLGHSPTPTPNAGVLYIDRSELTQRLTPLTQALQSLHNISYQIYKTNGFSSSCIQRDDVKCSTLIDGVTPFH